MPQNKLAVSLLSCDFSKLGQEAQRMLDFGVDYLHMDVMDGHFVPNLTLGACVIKSLRSSTNAFIDCHLMVSNPEKWVEDFSKAGTSLYMIHIEAILEPQNSLPSLIGKIKSCSMKVGLALSPGTPVESVLPYAGLVDMLLVMTVEPGFGGQAFIPSCLEKVKVIRKNFPELDIEVDGGINLDNIGSAAEAGANVFVAGNAILCSPDPKHTISQMRALID